MDLKNNVELELNDSKNIATLWLNRAQKMNALNWAMFSELDKYLDQLANNNQIRVILIRSKIPHFSSGIDLNLLSNQDPKAPKINFSPSEFRYYLHTILQPIFSKIAHIEKPVIAVINGLCLGSGFELALACDFRFATSKATFQMKEAQLGIIPDLGGTSRLCRLVNSSYAKEICLTAREISAKEGYQMGFLNGIAENLESTMILVNNLIENILKAAPLAIGMGKRCIDAIYSKSIAEGLESEAIVNSYLFNSQDFQEGITAILEKREPNWKGS